MKSKLELLVSRLQIDAAVLRTEELADLRKLGWIKRSINGHMQITKQGKVALQLATDKLISFE